MYAKIKQELKLYTQLKAQLEVENDRMRELHSKIVYGGTALKGMPGAKAWDKDKLGKATADLIDLEHKNAETFRRLSERIVRVETWYNSLPDGMYKAALYSHFIQGYSWQRVSRRLGNHKSADALRVGVDYLISTHKDSF
jgi:hypothetical protein